MKQVSKEEHDAFVLAYPGELIHGVATIAEPPVTFYQDTALNKIIARRVRNEDYGKPDTFWIETDT
jgi:hypothetical protein